MKNSVIAVAQAEEKNINWDKKFLRLHNIIPLSMTLIWSGRDTWASVTVLYGSTIH